MEQHSHLPQEALQSKAVLLVSRDPCCSPASPCQAWLAEVTSRLCVNVISLARVAGDGPRLWKLLSTQAAGSSGSGAQVTLENFTFLPSVKNSLSCCHPELVLSVSSQVRKNHAAWLGHAGALHAGRCFQVLTKAVGMRE